MNEGEKHEAIQRNERMITWIGEVNRNIIIVTKIRVSPKVQQSLM